MDGVVDAQWSEAIKSGLAPNTSEVRFSHLYFICRELLGEEEEIMS
jgi:hypothetical protein